MEAFIVIEADGEKQLLEMPHIRYYEFAVRNFKRHQVLSKTINKIRKNIIDLSEEEEKDAWYEFHNTSINTLIYSAFTLEGYINYYATKYKIPFHDEIEKKLTTKMKWEMYPKFKNKKSLSKTTLGLIKEIFDLRNDFVHPKPMKYSASGKSKKDNSATARLEKKNKGQLINQLNSIIKALFKIDEDENMHHEQQPWLKIMIKQPRKKKK